jgi:transcriptional regulator with XRE-family HTH domain
MISTQETLIRNKITGVLLRQARLHAGVDVGQCAAALSRDPAYIERAEEGREALTLPQLEGLAQVLDVPIQALLGEQELPDRQRETDPAYYERLMALRRKIVGVILLHARTEAGRTLEEVADVLGWEPEHLRGVEWGGEPISLVELGVLAETLGIPFEAFIDHGEPSAPQPAPPDLGPAREPALEPAHLAHLPPDVQEFVTQPINRPYLQIAMDLSQLPAETLRRLASGLLEITY